MPTPDSNQNHPDAALEAPPKLVAALQRLPQEPVFIPPMADEVVLRAARKHLAPAAGGTECARPRAQQLPHGGVPWEVPWLSWLQTLLRPRTGALRWLPWLTVGAAAILLLMALPHFSKRAAPTSARDSAFARWDLNRDGRVDILDAFSLARQLKQGAVSDRQLDFDGDGAVDERDVSAIAAHAVKLDRGGHS
jgi:hypothetical protein